MIKFGTLQIGRSVWGVVASTAICIAAIVAGSEAILRTPPVRAQLLLPILPGHYEHGPKIFLADEMTASEGGIDCFFVGSSIVGRAIIPEVFEEAYQRETGKPIRCFNFGIDTLTFKGEQNLAEILERRYHPRLIVFGAHFENFTTSPANGFEMDTDWARYQRGELNLEGFMESTLVGYRYALTYAQKTADLDKTRILSANLGPDGYRPNYDVDDAGRINRNRDKELFAAFDTFDIGAHRPELDQLLAADSRGASIILLDMPAPDATIAALERNGGDYQAYLTLLPVDAAAHGSRFIAAVPGELIPSNGFEDRIHMNTAGARVYSMWLGRQVAALGLP